MTPKGVARRQIRIGEPGDVEHIRRGIQRGCKASSSCTNAPESVLARQRPQGQATCNARHQIPMRHAVDYLYSLYDALVSINVPNDKARAVVDAMERDMATMIATKADLQLIKQELTTLIQTGVAELRQETTLIRKDMELLSTTMTVRLGSMLIVGLGLLFAALKLS